MTTPSAVVARHAPIGVAVGMVALIGTHARTALVGAVIGLALALASSSLFPGHARVRRVSVSPLVGLMAGALLFAPQITTWLARGQALLARPFGGERR